MKKEEKEKAVHPKEGMYHLICECGAGMATNGQLLRTDIIAGMSYRCPNRLYGKCNRTYSAQYFKDHALFVAPYQMQ